MTGKAVIKPHKDVYGGQMTRTYTATTREALVLLGLQIRAARKSRRMSEADLAKRVGIARSTLQQIEKGSATVEIGLVLEAAVLAGVSLFTPDHSPLVPEIARIYDQLQLLPKRIKSPTKEVKDDF